MIKCIHFVNYLFDCSEIDGPFLCLVFVCAYYLNVVIFKQFCYRISFRINAHSNVQLSAVSGDSDFLYAVQVIHFHRFPLVGV